MSVISIYFSEDKESLDAIYKAIILLDSDVDIIPVNDEERVTSLKIYNVRSNGTLKFDREIEANTTLVIDKEGITVLGEKWEVETIKRLKLIEKE